MIGTKECVWLYVGLGGLGWRIGNNWWRLKSDAEPMTYTERYSDKLKWRGLGLRLTCYVNHRQLHSYSLREKRLKG